jgi:hypothetical protein
MIPGRPIDDDEVCVQQQDLERIARGALKDLGVMPDTLRVVQDAQPGTWRIDFGGPKTLTVRCSSGTTAQWVREQIVNQYLAR